MISTSFKDAYAEGFNPRNEDLIKRYKTHLRKLDDYLPN
jgi:hypothetical protein